MKEIELNKLPELFRSGKITQKEAIDIICRFVIKNYPVFGLHKYDEDFRQDIMIGLIEKSPQLLQIFNPNYGDFFTFIYCYISTLINSKIKKCIMTSIREKINVEECILNMDEKQHNYHKIDFNTLEYSKVPFAQKKISPEEFQAAIKEISLKHQDKKILILALKSSYYLTDEQIERISKLYGIKPEYFYSMIQHCKETIDKKREKREKMMQRRNYAYYHHKRYNRMYQNLYEDEKTLKQELLMEKCSQKGQKHHNHWTKLNKTFAKGHLYLRPTNKTVANIMGICERQVNYYIKCAKKEVEELNNKEETNRTSEITDVSEDIKTSDNS